MPSATATPDIVRLPPQATAGVPSAIDRWFFSLSKHDRALVQARVDQVLASLPAAKRAEVNRNIARIEGTSIAGGLGYAATIGAITSGLLQAGVGLYGQKQSLEHQESLAKQQAETDKIIAEMQLEANKEIQQAMIEAQKEAAVLAAQSTVDVARVEQQGSVIRAQGAAHEELHHVALGFVAAPHHLVEVHVAKEQEVLVEQAS